MKKFFLILLIMLVSTPVFAVPGYEEAMKKIGGEPHVYDVSAQESYAQQLKKKFHEKHKDGAFTGEDYYIEVTVPYYDYLYEKQKIDKTGLESLHI